MCTSNNSTEPPCSLASISAPGDRRQGALWTPWETALRMQEPVNCRQEEAWPASMGAAGAGEPSWPHTVRETGLLPAAQGGGHGK